jgi:Lipase (class 3)
MIPLPTDAELVQCAAATYVPGAVPFLENPGFADRLFMTRRADGLTIFSVEGTYNAPLWIGDFLALDTEDQETKNHPTLGMVHADFYQAALRLLAPIETATRQGPVAVCGHSRGAALAAMICGLLLDDGYPVVKMGLFAPPRAGGALFVKIVTSVPFCAYRFGDDPVTEVPFTLPDFPYAQVPLTAIGRPMIPAIECHHIANYVAGVQATAPVAAMP